MRYALPALALLLAACGARATPTPIAVPDVSGLYGSFNDAGDGCRIHVEQLDVDRIEVELSCSRGGPSFNSGYLHDEFEFDTDTALWFSPYGNCQLVFHFAAGRLTIRTFNDSSRCGFGGGVTAYGEYPLDLNVTPVPMGCMRMEDPCGLRATSTP